MESGRNSNALVAAVKAGAQEYTRLVRAGYGAGLASDEPLSPRTETLVKGAAKAAYGVERAANSIRERGRSAMDRASESVASLQARMAERREKTKQARDEVNNAYDTPLTREDVVAPGAQLSPNLEGYVERTIDKINAQREATNTSTDDLSSVMLEYGKRTDAKLAKLRRRREKAERLAHGEEIRQEAIRVGANERPIVSPSDVRGIADFSRAMMSESGQMLNESREKVRQAGNKLKEVGKRAGEKIREKLPAWKRKIIAGGIGASALFGVMFDADRDQAAPQEGHRSHRQQEANNDHVAPVSTTYDAAVAYEPMAAADELDDTTEEMSSPEKKELEANNAIIKLLAEKVTELNDRIEALKKQEVESTGMDAKVVDIRGMLGVKNEIARLEQRRDEWQELMNIVEDLHIKEVYEVDELMQRRGTASRKFGPIGNTQRVA